MKTFLTFTLIPACLCASICLQARDINLDEIYIKKTSIYNRKLLLTKLDTYKDINAALVDRDIIFSNWCSGDELVYIKEKSKFEQNIIYKYHIHKRSKTELGRLKGVITIARISPNGRYLIIKRLVKGKKIIPLGERIIFKLKSREFVKKRSSYAFLDFTLPSNGNSIVYESNKRFIEKFIDSRLKRIILHSLSYNDIVISGNPTLAYLSNDRKKILVVNGSGGNYNARIFHGKKSYRVSGISSSTEIHWLDNSNFVFRKGSTGNYSVVIYNIHRKKTKTLLSKSFNTNINYSSNPMILSFLKDQVIHFYDLNKNELFNTGIEGEDITFSPNGVKFISLIFKKLFIVNIETLKKKRIELKRTWRLIKSIYDDLRNNKKEFTNEYSGYYINRKIRLYNDLL